MWQLLEILYTTDEGNGKKDTFTYMSTFVIQSVGRWILADGRLQRIAKVNYNVTYFMTKNYYFLTKPDSRGSTIVLCVASTSESSQHTWVVYFRKLFYFFITSWIRYILWEIDLTACFVKRIFLKLFGKVDLLSSLFSD